MLIHRIGAELGASLPIETAVKIPAPHGPSGEATMATIFDDARCAAVRTASEALRI